MLGDTRSYRIQVALFFITVLGLGFFFTVQVRSQASADQLLSGQDNVSLGLLITGLAQSNLRLVEARSDLGRQEQQLSASASSPNSAGQQLQQQFLHLQILNGTVPVHGPGVELKVGFTMQSFELQDLANSMRQLGAEAVSVNDRRLTARTVIGERNGALTVDGRSMSAPYDLRVVGEPAQLFARAGQLLTQLKARGYATLDQLGDIHITAVVRERPQVYSSFG